MFQPLLIYFNLLYYVTEPITDHVPFTSCFYSEEE